MYRFDATKWTRSSCCRRPGPCRRESCRWRECRRPSWSMRSKVCCNICRSWRSSRHSLDHCSNHCRSCTCPCHVVIRNVDMLCCDRPGVEVNVHVDSLPAVPVVGVGVAVGPCGHTVVDPRVSSATSSSLLFSSSDGVTRSFYWHLISAFISSHFMLADFCAVMSTVSCLLSCLELSCINVYGFCAGIFSCKRQQTSIMTILTWVPQQSGDTHNSPFVKVPDCQDGAEVSDTSHLHNKVKGEVRTRDWLTYPHPTVEVTQWVAEIDNIVWYSGTHKACIELTLCSCICCSSWLGLLSPRWCWRWCDFRRETHSSARHLVPH